MRAGIRAIAVAVAETAARLWNAAQLYRKRVQKLEVPQEAYGRWRTLILPGVKVTVGDQLEALERAKPGASALVERKPDAAIDAIVSTIPANFSAAKALSLGFPAAPDLDGIIQEHIALTATAEAAAAPVPAAAVAPRELTCSDLVAA